MTSVLTFLYRILYRIYHFALKLVTKVVPFPRPSLYQGKEALNDLVANIEKNKLQKLLLVTDDMIKSLGLHENLLKALEANGITIEIYSNVQPNPSIANVEEGVKVYLLAQCQGVICLGGGSVMDCAKLIAVRIARPNKTIPELKGLFRVLRRLPPIYAIPTTAGTGSETTIVAVVSDPANKQKYALTDISLTPKAAVLLPELTYGLPPQITSVTGMDALTHAIEAFVGITGTKFTNQRAMDASRLIFCNLLGAYQDGKNKQYRRDMLLASFYAGEAFTRASVGYVHAIAHSLGGLYGTAHGLANAVILPKVLRWYGAAVEHKLATLADYCQITADSNTPSSKALAFIEAIEKLNKQMDIATGITDLKTEDIPMLAKKALDEAHPEYPVPKFMNQEDCQNLLSSLLLEK